MFSVLCPHFTEKDDIVKRSVELMFPKAPENLLFVVEHCLASLVYHSQHLINTLVSQHSLFATPLFQNPELLRELGKRVKCGVPAENEGMKATGIPPHVSLLAKMTHLHEASQETVRKISRTKDEIISGIVKELEERAIGARTVTYDGLQETILKCFADSGINDLVQRVRNPPEETRVESSHSSFNRESLAHFWGGRFRRLPEDFRFQDITTRQLWLLWMCGDQTRKIIPLRLWTAWTCHR